MLELLHIENVAVIEKAEIEFGPGLNVLTGETGAGKSIVIDSLQAVIGGRVSKELVRTGAKNALITASFSDVASEGWLEDNEIEQDEDGRLIVSRRISSEGKNTCRVNGCPVTAAQLRELGTYLVDIHGQNDGRKLMDESSHLKYLDGYAGHEKLMLEYAGAYEQLKSVRAELKELAMDEGEKARRIDTLKYQIDEIEAANMVPGEIDEKTSRRDLLKNASKLTDALDSAFYAMYGGDRMDGAVALIGQAEDDISGASRYSDSFAPLAQKLTDLRYAAEDAAEELRDFKDSLDFSPQELDELEMRLKQLKRMTRKYGGDENEVLEYLDKCRRELTEIELSADKVDQLEKKEQKCLEAAKKCARELSESRKKAAKKLEKQIIEELSGLSMKGVKFCVEFLPAAGEDGINASGCDEVRFLMSANAGEEPGRISRIASGGELSRIMLAMKNVLSENDVSGTMVFDEIDTGVSGIAAQRVGEKLCCLAGKKQVLCVTHLPQIAAIADEHFVIEKTQSDDRTFTHVNKLEFEGRKREIARLTGGENITELTLSSAAEQLKAADEFKQSRME